MRQLIHVPMISQSAIAEQVLGGGIETLDDPLLVDDDDPIGHRIDDDIGKGLPHLASAESQVNP